MHIEKNLDVINACRFCFMCRHLDPVGNVTFREADTPRGRALICDRIRMDAANLSNADYIDTLYRSALSAANRFQPVTVPKPACGCAGRASGVECKEEYNRKVTCGWKQSACNSTGFHRMTRMISTP